MMAKVIAWLRARTPRQILLASLVIFLVYAWPGFVGWDTREHMVQSRAGVYTDGHPPILAFLVRICELFITGPALLLLIQAITLLVGLYLVLKSRLSPRAAAIAASVIYLFPYVSGVTGLINKDSLMAGPLMIGIGLMLDERMRSHRWALLWLFIASLMRWNALAATFAPMILLFRWSPSSARLRRYAISTLAWFAVTAAAYETNDLMTDQREYLWYWGYAYVDIAGTIANMPDTDDATLNRMLDGVPLVYHDHLYDRFKANYNPAYQYHLVRAPTRLFTIATTETQRDAIYLAWKRFVFGFPRAYFAYRVDAFRMLLSIDRPPSFSNVYIWFNVIAAPEVIAELGHDAGASRIQQRMIDASIWISLTPVYYTFIYFALCLLLLPFVRRRLEIALLLSAIGYELQWFFLAVTADLRYSQWMAMCTFVAGVLIVARWRGVERDAGVRQDPGFSRERAPSPAP
jgi:hypothetical protein